MRDYTMNDYWTVNKNGIPRQASDVTHFKAKLVQAVIYSQEHSLAANRWLCKHKLNSMHSLHTITFAANGNAAGSR